MSDKEKAILENDKQVLKAILTEKFNNQLENGINSVCKSIIRISGLNGLGFDYIEDLKEKYFNKFNEDFNS